MAAFAYDVVRYGSQAYLALLERSQLLIRYTLRPGKLSYCEEPKNSGC